jgi:hypothetical protein
MYLRLVGGLMMLRFPLCPLFKDVLYDLLIPNSIQPVSVQRCPNFILALFRI